MHRLFFFSVIYFLTHNFLFAQDNIVLKNGEELKAKVEEIGQTEIKYKKFENLSGPVYVISKEEVLMIKYENSSKDVFVKSNDNTSTSDGHKTCSLPKNFAGDYRQLQKLGTKQIVSGAVMTGIGVPTLLTGIGFTVGGFISLNETYNNPPNQDFNFTIPLFAAGGLFTAIGATLTVLGPITLKRGINYHKMAREKKTSVGFAPIVNPELNRIDRALLHQQKLAGVTFTF